MPTYVLPQVLVFQDFQTVPSVVANPLRAHISGGHAFLVRYSDEDEREDGRLGYYDDAVETCYLWPNRPAGAQVDDSYTKLWMKDALLEYFTDPISGGSLITKLTNYNNRISSDSVNFKTNGIYARNSDLYDRDVQLGDTVRLRIQPSGSDPTYMWTYVKDIIGDEAAAVINTATSDTNNPATQIESSTITKTKGPDNCITLTADTSGYDGLEDGYITETYTIKVLASSINSDLSTARIRVISASGEDDVLELNPQDNGVPTAIGSRGLFITFADDDTAACSQSADNDSVNYNDLVAGQEWQVVVNQAWTAPTPTEGDTYDDDNDTTYIVEVTNGGLWADSPAVSVTTTNGIDLSGPTTVTGAAVDIPVGTKGVTISFSGNGLRFGDKYYIEVAGIAEGPMRTLELGNNIPTTVPGGSEVGLTLYIRKPLLEITENKIGFAPQTNWTQSETEICVESAVVAYDETWTDEGVPLPLDVKSDSSQDFGLLYAEYRAWRSDLAFEVGTIGDVGELNDLIDGALHPDNPLKWGVFKALSNSNGTQVKYTAVQDPDDSEDWVDMLELLLGRDDVYGLVPLTRLRIAQDLIAAHVDAQSSPEQGLWRVCWFALDGVPEIPVVHAGSTVSGYVLPTTDDGEVALATYEDDPLTSGNQYTILRVPAGNANFIQNDVRPGDIVRGLYVGDGFGEFTYTEFIIDEVQSEDQLRLLTGPNAPQTVATKIEVWRNLSPTEEALEIARDAGAWNNRRIRAVWPDLIESGGTVQEGYHVAAALAGLSSGILPHQGMTRLEVAGFSDVPRTNKKFNRPQLDSMAVAGVWIVTQDLFDGKIFNRHAVTTGDYEDINEREEMVTRNVDSISYRFKDHFEPFIGISNVTPSMQNRLAYEVRALVEVLKTERATEQLGGQLVEGNIRELRPHLTLKDRYVLFLDVTIPYPLNNFEIHLVI
jgi:hypothetical protein